MGIFDSIANLAGDVVKLVSAPVEVVIDVADAVVKPLAEVATELTEDIKDLIK